MPLENEAAEAAADNELSSLLSAELDRAEGVTTPEPAAEPEPEAQPEVNAEQPSDDRPRDDKGRFAPKADEKPEPAKAVEVQPKAPEQQPQPTPVAAQPDPAQTQQLAPPPGWSPAAKVAFGALPAEVQQAVAKREEEVNKGFAKLAEYRPIDKFMEMARQSGTSLDRALENYTGIENALRRDFVGGIASICQRQGVDPVALANVILARSGVSPAQPGEAGAAQRSNQTAPQVDLSPVMQKISALEGYIQQQQSAAVDSEISRFASDPKNVFFANVKEQMGHLINAGVASDLNDAYDKACWANPEIRPLLIKQQQPQVSEIERKAQAATQARQAAKSITGSPLAGASSRGGPATSIEDDLRAAFDAAAV